MHNGSKNKVQGVLTVTMWLPPTVNRLLNRITALALTHLFEVFLFGFQVEGNGPGKRQHGCTVVLQLLKSSSGSGLRLVDTVTIWVSVLSEGLRE
jgi:hypothetical protein